MEICVITITQLVELKILIVDIGAGGGFSACRRGRPGSVAVGGSLGHLRAGILPAFSLGSCSGGATLELGSLHTSL